MAVYTKLLESDISELLSKFNLNLLHTFESAADGIQNTTYFLTLVDDRRLVLTLFENRSGDELPFYTTFIKTLNAAGLPVPCALQDKKGVDIQQIFDKPVLLFPLIQGQHLETATVNEISQMGTTLAKIHLTSLELPFEHTNPLGVQWMQQTLALIEDSLSPADKKLIEKQIQVRSNLKAAKLPSAVIHADLFRDNVLFHQGKVAAVIDFFDAGTDCLILDIAVVINDWCVNAEGLVDSKKRTALLEAYERSRTLTKLEKAHLHEALQIAATCVWLSRTKGQLLAKLGSGQVTKDPNESKNLLLQHINSR
ncbi:MAG: homoserine kinase type II [Pseudohongiellaceae bacterium]|jgi:homoserine kinase type II